MRAMSMLSPAYGHAAFVLLAEFDIDQGSVLTHQYPHPMGIDEQQVVRQKRLQETNHIRVDSSQK
jgi:hypothetical protein